MEKTTLTANLNSLKKSIDTLGRSLWIRQNTKWNK